MFERLRGLLPKKPNPLSADRINSIIDAAAYNMERCAFMRHILTLRGPFGAGFPTPKMGYMYWLYHVVRVRMMKAYQESHFFEKNIALLDEQIGNDIEGMNGDLYYFSQYHELSCQSMKEDQSPGWVYWQGKLTWASVLYGELSFMADEKHDDWLTYFSGNSGPLAMKIPTDAAIDLCKVIEKLL